MSIISGGFGVGIGPPGSGPSGTPVGVTVEVEVVTSPVTIEIVTGAIVLCEEDQED